MVDIDISHYSTGTATVGSNGTAVTGQGTAWVGAVRPGDLFGTHVGLPIRILSVESNTSLTLAHPWPGDAQAAAPYEIQRSPYELGYQRAVEELIAGISEGNVPLLADLTAAANKLPYFDSPNSMALADLSPFARTLLDDANAAAARGTLGMTPFWQSRITVDATAEAARAGLGADRVPAITSFPLDSDFNAYTAPGWSPVLLRSTPEGVNPSAAPILNKYSMSIMRGGARIILSSAPFPTRA